MEETWEQKNHEISNWLYKNNWKSKFNIPKVENEEE